jgi:hypothetical protein
MKFNLIIYAILIAATCSPLLGGNSVFSYEGTPCQNYGNDIYGMGMGDVGVSDIFRKNTGYGNPAMMGSANQAMFSTGMVFGWTNYVSVDNVKRKFRDNSLDFPFFSASIPINNHRIGFQFNSMASGVATNAHIFTADSLTITEKQSINRYLYRADLMYGYRFKNFNLGVGVNYYLGHDIRTFEQSAGYGIFNTKEKLESSYKNATGTVGLISKFDKLSLGAYYSLGTDLDGETIRSSIHETENLGSMKHSIADHIALGVTYRFSDDFRASSDIHYDLWENTKHSINDKNSIKIGLGLAHDPKTDSKHSFVAQMPKRLGFSYRTLPFEVNNKAVTETAITAGFTLPIKHSDNQLDLGLQYLMRGNESEHNLQDTSFMFMLGITGFDIFTREFKRTAPRSIPVAEDIIE